MPGIGKSAAVIGGGGQGFSFGKQKEQLTGLMEIGSERPPESKMASFSVSDFSGQLSWAGWLDTCVSMTKISDRSNLREKGLFWLVITRHFSSAEWL